MKALENHLWDQAPSLKRHPIVGDVRGKGFLLGMEFVRGRETKAPFEFAESGHVANLVAKKAFENGLVIYPGSGTVDGHRGDHLLIAPPFVITKGQIDELVGRLDQSISAVERELDYIDGYDLTLHCEKYILPDMDATRESNPLLLEKVARNELGAKTGKGFYEWTPEFTEAWRKRLLKGLIRYVKGRFS